MANSRFRCAGCHDYHRQPEHRRLGNVRVCSDRCAELYLENSRPQRPFTNELRRAGKPPAPAPAQGSPIPTVVRAEVLARDRSRCRFCGGTAHQVHHICYRSEGVDHSPHNLISLCREHHDLVHSNKRVYKPLLLATIWFEYVERKHLTVIQVQRVLRRYGFVP